MNSLDSLVSQIRKVRSEKLPQEKIRLEKLQSMRQALDEAKQKSALISNGDLELSSKISSVGIDKSLQIVSDAIVAEERVVSRLSRESINIGVAGMARQGKSQLLQTLTGLKDQQIPTGDGGYCTGSRSVIKNEMESRALVYYKSEADLLEKIILPSFTSLGISPRPGSVCAFAQNPLSEIDGHLAPSKRVEWQYLKELHDDLNRDSKLLNLLGSAPTNVGFNDIRKYVTKDEGDRIFQVVDHVEIQTPFDSGLPRGMLVFDLPGLRDPSPGIRDAMLKSISEDTDIVFLIRKPSLSGDDWGEDDNDIMDMLDKVYDSEIKPKDWSLLILNHFVRGGVDNGKNVNAMLEKVAGTYPGFSAVSCNCANKDEVRAMVQGNIETLVQQTSRIDNLRIGQADAAYKLAVSAVRSVADAFSAAIGQTIARVNGFDEDGHRDQFWADLRAPFKMPVEKQLDGMQEKFKESLKAAFGAAYAKIKKLYEECGSVSGAEFPPEFPVFTKKQLVTFLKGARGTKDAIDRAARNQLSAVVELLRGELQGCCEELRTIYLCNVVQSVTKNNSAIESLLRTVSQQEKETPEAVFTALKNRLEEGGDSMETVVSALENLLHFDVSYETQLLPYLFDVPELSEKFDPYSPNADLGELETYLNREHADNFETQADVLFNSLKNYSLNWIAPLANARSEGPCQEVSKGVMRVVKANYRNFIAMFVWGEKTESEWKRYMRDNAATLWPEDFEKAASQSQLGKQLRNIVALLRKSAS